jgi:hypothetical protein
LRPSARLYAAESEVLTVNTTKSHRRFDHVFFSYRSQLTLIANLIYRLLFIDFQENRIEIEKKYLHLLTTFGFKKRDGIIEKNKKCKKINLNVILTCINCLLPFLFEG